MASMKRELVTYKISGSAVILDIEGTTSSITFVKDKLFPYIRDNLENYLIDNWGSEEFQEYVKALRTQAKEDEENKVEGVITIPGEGEEDVIKKAIVDNIKWQMDNDRKTKCLKDLQGLIMEKGYKSGVLKGHVYDDVEQTLKTWSEQDKSVYIYSSGSIHAQKLLFHHSEKGDLLQWIKGHFDTSVGMKGDVNSYKEIVKQINASPSETVFFTDVPKEARAAKDAGIVAILVSREGNPPLLDEDKAEFKIISSFEDVEFESSCKKMKLSSENSVTDDNKELESCVLSVDDKSKPHADHIAEETIADNCLTKASAEPIELMEVDGSTSDNDMEEDIIQAVCITKAKPDELVDSDSKDIVGIAETKPEEQVDSDSKDIVGITKTKQEELVDSDSKDTVGITKTKQEELVDSGSKDIIGITKTEQEELVDSDPNDVIVGITKAKQEELVDSDSKDIVGITKTKQEELVDSDSMDTTGITKAKKEELIDSDSKDIIGITKAEQEAVVNGDTKDIGITKAKQEDLVDSDSKDITSKIEDDSEIDNLKINCDENKREMNIKHGLENEDSKFSTEASVTSEIEEEPMSIQVKDELNNETEKGSSETKTSILKEDTVNINKNEAEIIDSQEKGEIKRLDKTHKELNSVKCDNPIAPDDKCEQNCLDKEVQDILVNQKPQDVSEPNVMECGKASDTLEHCDDVEHVSDERDNSETNISKISKDVECKKDNENIQESTKEINNQTIGCHSVENKDTEVKTEAASEDIDSNDCSGGKDKSSGFGVESKCITVDNSASLANEKQSNPDSEIITENMEEDLLKTSDDELKDIKENANDSKTEIGVTHSETLLKTSDDIKDVENDSTQTEIGASPHHETEVPTVMETDNNESEKKETEVADHIISENGQDTISTGQHLNGKLSADNVNGICNGEENISSEETNFNGSSDLGNEDICNKETTIEIKKSDSSENMTVSATVIED